MLLALLQNILFSFLFPLLLPIDALTRIIYTLTSPISKSGAPFFLSLFLFSLLIQGVKNLGR